MVFDPELPLGARLLRAEFQGHKIDAKSEIYPGDEHIKVTLALPPGASHCHLKFTGGVSVSLPPSVLRPGDPSTNLKLVAVRLSGNELSIDADVHPQGNATLFLKTPWPISAEQGSTIFSVSDNEYRVELARGRDLPSGPGSKNYTRTHVVLKLK
jgi:hypothetical protein